MANLQIKGIDDNLYAQIKSIASSENRSISQQVLYVMKSYMANKKAIHQIKSPARVLMDLSGSWEDDGDADEIISRIKKARKSSKKLQNGF